MPFRGERAAPIFDHDQPSMLQQYFAQLDRLFTRCTIASDREKKDFATSFLKAGIAECWEALPEFSDSAKTFPQFHNQVTDRYTIHDLAHLVSDHVQSGIRSLQDLGTFHLQYNMISSYLIEQDFLSSHEQSESQQYFRVFDAAQQSQIDLRLQIKYPQQSPTRLHSIDTMFEAARWILQIPTAQNAIPTHLTASAVLPTVPTRTAAIPTIPITPQAFDSLSSKSAFVTTQQLNAILSTVSHIVVAAIHDSNTVQSIKLLSPIVPVSARSSLTSSPVVSIPIASTSAPTTITSLSLPTRPTAAASIPTVPTIVTASLTETEIRAAEHCYKQTKCVHYMVPVAPALTTIASNLRQPILQNPVAPIAIRSKLPLVVKSPPSTVALVDSPLLPSHSTCCRALSSSFSPLIIAPHIAAPVVLAFHAADSVVPVTSYTALVEPSSIAIVAPITITPTVTLAHPCIAPVVKPVVVHSSSSIALVTPPVVTQIVPPIVAPIVPPIVALETLPIVSLILSPSIVTSSPIIPIVAPIVSLAPSSPIEPPQKILPTLIVPAVTSYVLVALARILALLSLRQPPYKRNHARLKYTHLEF